MIIVLKHDELFLKNDCKRKSKIETVIKQINQISAWYSP